MKDIVFFDLETTGLDPVNDRIVEFFARRVKVTDINGLAGMFETVKEYHSYFNPGMKIPEKSTAIHRITNEVTDHAPKFYERAKEIISIFDGAVISGFNIDNFDLNFLRFEFRRCGTFEHPFLDHGNVIDVYKIFDRFFKKDLQSAHQFYCGEPFKSAHSAAADVDATQRILAHMIMDHRQEMPNNTDQISQWINLPFGNQCEPSGRLVFNEYGAAIFTFGKYSNWTLEKVAGENPGYLKFLIEKDFHPQLKEICKDALRGVFIKRAVAA